MKARIVQHITKITLFSAVLLAACLLGRPAYAQSQIQGSFTLSHETHWGQAVLPPGDYQLRFVINNGGPLLVIRDAKSRLVVAYESARSRETSITGESAILIGKHGNQQVVQSLRIAELGESFVYERPPAHGRAGEEARKTQVVPVLMAKK